MTLNNYEEEIIKSEPSDAYENTAPAYVEQNTKLTFSSLFSATNDSNDVFEPATLKVAGVSGSGSFASGEPQITPSESGQDGGEA